MTSAFDTLQAAKQLEGCGFKREQAEAVAAVVQSVQGDLATKADLSATEAALKADLSATEAALKADFKATEASFKADLKATEASFKAELLKVAVAVIGLNAAIMFGLLRLFMGQG
ncbi:MAG: hypothetical protein OXG51_17455 [Gammaproteobacteria bacterium]|nr:hypothetical protein [Gammaproteobacteria bacterium]